MNTTNTLHYSALSERLEGDNENAWAVHDQALELKRQGEDVILLSVGDPDFRTPEPIIDNAISYMRVGRTHYSPALGELNFRRAVADTETRTSPRPCRVENVAIFPGATSALYSVMACLLNAGDEVIIPDPMYVGYPGIMHSLDAAMVNVPVHPERGFIPASADIEAAIGPRTAVVLINTPGNPTGAMIDRGQLAELAALCLEHNIWLVCDEVYSMFTFEHRHVSLRAAAENLNNLVMVDGLSKSHAMSGWRMGWVIAPPPLIERLGKFSAISLFGSPQFIQDGAAFALGNDQDYVARMCAEYKQRRDYLVERIQHIPGLDCHVPAAGMFIMADVRAINPDDSAFAWDLLNQQQVCVVPGCAFGNSTRGYVRITMAQPRPVLGRAMDRIAEFAAAGS